MERSKWVDGPAVSTFQHRYPDERYATRYTASNLTLTRRIVSPQHSFCYLFQDYNASVKYVALQRVLFFYLSLGPSRPFFVLPNALCVKCIITG